MLGLGRADVAAALIAIRGAKSTAKVSMKAEVARAEKQKEVTKEEEEKNSIKTSLKTAEIELLIGKQLSTRLIASHQELAFRMGKMRKKFATQYGFVVPEVRLTDDSSIPSKSYQIKIHGTVVAEHKMRVGEVMVLLGALAAGPAQAVTIKGGSASHNGAVMSVLDSRPNLLSYVESRWPGLYVRVCYGGHAWPGYFDVDMSRQGKAFTDQVAHEFSHMLQLNNPELEKAWLAELTRRAAAFIEQVQQARR